MTELIAKRKLTDDWCFELMPEQLIEGSVIDLERELTAMLKADMHETEDALSIDKEINKRR